MPYRAFGAELLGSILLAATVIGSGIMAERLAGGNLAVALLANTGATVAVLATLIALFGPISGAHFNPAVSIVQAIRGKLTIQKTVAYVIMQIAGCCLGAFLSHAMFELPLIQASLHLRTGPAQWLSEAVATAGLILVVIGSANPNDAAWRVSAWIGAAYWFTASTSFANPAITIARSLSNTFAGIAPTHVTGFIAAQLCGALLGLLLAKFLLSSSSRRAHCERIVGDRSFGEQSRIGRLWCGKGGDGRNDACSRD
jgi:glycerol uptake facilitator-like aquaporin